MKDLCQKWKVKLIFRSGIVECLEIIDAGCNLKQFDGLTRLIPTPHILRQIYATAYIQTDTVTSANMTVFSPVYVFLSVCLLKTTDPSDLY